MLLINPSLDPFRKSPEKGDDISNYVPLSIITVAQFYREQGRKVKVLDSRLYSSEDFVKLLKSEVMNHNTVGISVNTYTIHESYVITKLLKSLGKKVIWGGVHPRLYPEQCKSIADEIITIDLKPRSLIPAYDLLDIEKYIKRVHKDNRIYRVLDIQFTRGCPYRCAFCINPIFHGKKYTIPDIEDSKSAVKYIIEKYKLNHIVFLDENFFVNKNFATQIIKSLPKGVTFTADCRANYFEAFSPKLKSLLREKCKMLFIGAESGVQRILNLIKKDITVEDIWNANEECIDMNIIPNMSFIIGLPTETIDEMKQTMDFMMSLRNRNPLFYYIPQQPFRPYPGCEIYDELKKKGFIKEPKKIEEWIKYIYEDSMPWIDSSTFSFLKKLVFYSSKARRMGNNTKSRIAYHISNFRIKNNLFLLPIELKFAKDYRKSWDKLIANKYLPED